MGSSSVFTVRSLLLCSVAVLLLLVHSATPAPADEMRINCRMGTDRRNVCERCSKITKDYGAYELCCTKQPEYQFCYDFQNYKLKP